MVGRISVGQSIFVIGIRPRRRRKRFGMTFQSIVLDTFHTSISWRLALEGDNVDLKKIDFLVR
jgi:hypothetical protein